MSKVVIFIYNHGDSGRRAPQVCKKLHREPAAGRSPSPAAIPPLNAANMHCQECLQGIKTHVEPFQDPLTSFTGEDKQALQILVGYGTITQQIQETPKLLNAIQTRIKAD